MTLFMTSLMVLLHFEHVWYQTRFVCITRALGRQRFFVIFVGFWLAGKVAGFLFLCVKSVFCPPLGATASITFRFAVASPQLIQLAVIT